MISFVNAQGFSKDHATNVLLKLNYLYKAE